MHIAIVSIRLMGHVLPTLPFVKELVKRGVRVTYFTTEDFRELVNPTGAKFIPVRSWMAVHAPQNENANAAGDNSVEASVPFLFLKEAGEYIDTILGVLKKDRPDAILHDFAGIAGTIAADVLKIPNIMLYPSYPSNDTSSVAEYFEGIAGNHPLHQTADEIAETYAQKYGCRKMTVREIFDGHGDFNIVMMQKRFFLCRRQF